jgi:hypothetical protein
MAYQFIDVERGIDTLELQQTHPEWFIVKGKKGAESWTLRPDIRAALRQPYESARRKWEEAHDWFELTDSEQDRQAALTAALEFKAVDEQLDAAESAIHAKYDRELPN